MLIGVLSDTHIPDRTGELPSEIFDLFRNVELILHAGDVCVPAVLERLSALAPVVAVRGNRDKAVPDLPEKTVVCAGQWRIGLIHGTQPPLAQTADRLRYLRGDRRFLDQRRYMLAAFADDAVQCIVFGHTHHACSEVVEGVVLFNPGGVVPAWRGEPSSVGLLDAGPQGITARTIPLQRPPHIWTVPEQVSLWLTRNKGT